MGLTENLFVYGSLMRGQNGGEMMDHLAAEGAFLGPATCTGKLYLIDWYPGFVPDDGNDIVHGEVFALPQSSDLWAKLDRYEGIGSDFPEPQEYIRVQKNVDLGGTTVSAWIYAYNWPVAKKPRITSGRFSKQ